MPKLTKLQKKWIADSYGGDNCSTTLLTFLVKLKVINETEFHITKTIIYTSIKTWIYAERDRAVLRLRREKARTYESRPPKSIKPTQTRS